MPHALPTEPSILQLRKLREVKESWAMQHRLAWGRRPHVVQVLLGAEEWIRWYRLRFQSLPSADYVLGPGIRNILLGARVLLDADLDGLDGGTLGTLILDIARYGGWEDLDDDTPLEAA